MKINDIIVESVEESASVKDLKKGLIAAKNRGINMDYDGVAEVMERVWTKHNMTGKELHDVFVKEVGSIPDTWIKKQKQVKEIIQRTPADATDWQSNQKAKEIPGLKMVPGSNQYGYNFETLKGKDRLNLTGTDVTVNFYDTKARGGMLHIGYINFRNTNFPPYKKAIQVSNVALDSRYRGKGVGIMMYTTVLQLGYVIVADETQTPQARKLWVNLNQAPGVEVRGRVEVFRSDIDVENAYDEWDQRKAKANLRKLKNIGAIMIGELENYRDNDYVPFDFSVQPGKNGAELATKGFKLYSSKHPEDLEEDYFVNLYARWVG